jgi:hypothetical protein
VRKPYQVRAAIPSTNKGIAACTCTHCGKIATKEALFKRGGVIMIEKYCDSCLQAEKFTALMTFYERTQMTADS